MKYIDSAGSSHNQLFPALPGGDDHDHGDHDHDDHDLHFLGGNLIIVTTTIITTSWDPEKQDAGSISFKNVFKTWVAVDTSPI